MPGVDAFSPLLRRRFAMAFPPSLRSFGGASIEGPEGPLTGRGTQRHRLALLALLAVESRGMSRDKLAALLWPEHPADKARHALSDSVYRIGKELGDGALVSIGVRDLRLVADRVPSDVARFRSAIARGDWEAAAAAYEGPFLDGFHLSGCAEFERWMEAQRLRFQEDHARVLEALAKQRADEGDPEGAVAAWRRRASADPYDSRVAARLMEALVAAGNPAAALRHGEEHAELLRREVGVDPDSAVATVAARVRATPAAAVPQPVIEVSGANPVPPGVGVRSP